MMKIKNIVLPILMMLISEPTWAVDLQAATDDICSCLKAPYEVVEKALGDIQKAQSTGDYSKIMQAQGEMMGIMNASTNCFEKLPGKYPEIDKNEELQSKVMNMADKQCPNPAKGYFQ